MSRFIFTNNRTYYDRINKINVDCGFYISESLSKNYYFTNYKKCNVNNYNFCFVEDDFVASVGTFLYKGMIGEKAYIEIYSDFKSKGVKYVRSNIVGTYALFVKIGNIVNVFIDESGNYALYYYEHNGEYILTNLMYHIGLLTSDEIDKFALLEELNEYCILDNKTFFVNVKRLMANEVIEVDVNSSVVEVKPVECNEYYIQDHSFEGVVDLLAKTIVKYARMQSVFGNEKMLFMTGGMDSRLTLAGDIAADYKTILANWQGSPDYMNTKKEDKEVSLKIADAFGLDFVSIDVSNDELHTINDLEYKTKGEYACIYGNNRLWHNFFAETNNYFFDFGYFGETVKEWSPLEYKYHKNFTIDDYCELYMTRQKHDYCNLSHEELQEYAENIKNKLKKICEDSKIDISNLSKEDCMYLYYIYRTHADTKMVNFANIYGYCFNIYAQKELIDYINQCPYEYKRKGKLNLALTKKMCSELMSIPYYSHCQYINYDASKMVLEAPNNDKISDQIKRIIPVWLKKKLKKIFRKNMKNVSIKLDIINKFDIKGIKESWLPQVDEDTYGLIGEYKSYYDYYVMLRELI